MRKITKEAAAAFFEKRYYKSSNTEVHSDQQLRLHGHLISYVDKNGDLNVSLAGWPTVTTRERLNGILRDGIGASVYQHDGDQYIAPKIGDPVCISPFRWYIVRFGEVIEA